MESQAKVFLRALNGNINISERAIVLSPENIIRIGRASKSPNKNLTAAVDNAWFDSPVMSREHAELQFHSQNSTVTIRDIGSMHGTFVNSTRLLPHVTNNLSNGDTLVLGIEVKRGSEIFPACSFIFNYELIPYTSTIPSTSEGHTLKQ
ncbi:SMAD/FHA domain-containing protein [Bisporella sp. PMI_857]|nr:SMAD/FHA domain-containing protein [Bisporella sp. PMI_857]